MSSTTKYGLFQAGFRNSVSPLPLKADICQAPQQFPFQTSINQGFVAPSLIYVDTSSANSFGNSANASPVSCSNTENGHLLQIKTEPPSAYSPPICSPSSSINEAGIGHYATSSQNNHSDDRTKKKPFTVRPNSDELCLVCGDRASGYHYNALACEGCKGFFRRSITKGSNYICKFGGSCEMDMYMRRKCQACRLKKCYLRGMRADCVVPESACQKKRAAKKAQQSSSGRSSVTDNSSIGQHILSISEMKKSILNPSPSPVAISTYSNTVLPPTLTLVTTKPLKPEEEELINRLVFFQEEFEHPTEEDLSRVYHVPISDNGAVVPGEDGENESYRLFRHMTEMTILTVQLIVEFSKHLPGFQTLCREDQISLLKGCSSEVMMLRGARRYDPLSDSIIYATNYPFTKENYAKAGLSNDELFRFCRSMSKMKVDNAEYALITAIVIFSERVKLKEPRRVEKIQEIYLDALQAYVMANRKANPIIVFGKLLAILTELRTLGNSNSELCFSLKLKHRKLPPFLMEIWDIDC